MTTPMSTTSIPRPIQYCKFYIDVEFGYSCLLLNMTFLRDEDAFVIAGIHQYNKSDKDVSGVRIKFSQLFKVPRVIFDQFTNLDFLDIGSTELRLLDGKTFEKCGNLKYLDVSDNLIRSIPGEALGQCTELRSLNLNDNSITTIEPCNNFMKHLPHLTSLFMRLNICISDTFLSHDLFTNVYKSAYDKMFRCFSFWFIP